jgi:hypothetical protein
MSLNETPSLLRSNLSGKAHRIEVLLTGFKIEPVQDRWLHSGVARGSDPTLEFDGLAESSLRTLPLGAATLYRIHERDSTSGQLCRPLNLLRNSPCYTV